MMSQTCGYQYYENDLFQAISIPYEKERRFSFYVFLPKKDSSLNAFYETLNTDNWEQWIRNFSYREGFIRLPHFKIEYDVTLKEDTAAAAVPSTSAVFSPPPFQMIVDRPFFCAIRENGTGTILFMGSILAPGS